jgi:hypothetical protein
MHGCEDCVMQEVRSSSCAEGAVELPRSCGISNEICDKIHLWFERPLEVGGTSLCESIAEGSKRS